MTDTAPSNDTDLLLVHADDMQPVLGAPLSCRDAKGGEPATDDGPQYLWDESRSANDLAVQGYGVVVPEGPRGDELLGCVAALIARRREQQEGREVLVYRVPPRQTAAEAARWRKDVFEAPGIRRRDIPRYVLILGDFDEVALELQVILGAEGYVGRLAFDRPRDYEAYVDKLLRWEDKPAAIDRARTVFHTVQDRTAATRTGHIALMAPGLTLARRYLEQGELHTSEVIAIDHGHTPKAQPMVEEAIKEEPGLLFTMSHGAGAPRRGWGSLDDQRERQGSMSFGSSGGLLTGEALRDQCFLPGGVWFMLACFGAGTPSTSKYEPWLRDLQAGGHFQGDVSAVGASLPSDGRPFVAAMPKATLASADGPIAFIGHVDLAWTYAFRELDGERPVNRPNRFLDVFTGVLRGDRLGVAFRELLRHYGATNNELTSLVESGVVDTERRGHLWMLRNDLAGYVLLGDPAATLPIRKTVQAAAQAINPYAALGLAPTQAASAEPVVPSVPAVDADPEALERAIGLYLAGELGTAKILRECGLDLGRRQFEELAKRYAAAGRKALGLEW